MPADFDRRTVLGGGLALLAASLAASPRAALAATPVKFQLAWLMQGSVAYAVAGKKLGYFERRNIDLTIVRGTGSGPAAQAAATGAVDFAINSTPFTIVTAGKGLPIVSLGTYAYDTGMGITVLEGSPIDAPKDLEGKTVGVVPTSGEIQFFGDFAKRTGFDADKVRIVNLDGKVLEQSLVGKRIDAMIGFATSSAPIFAAQGVPVRWLSYKSFGMGMYGTSFTTRRQTVQDKPELVAAFMDAMLESLVWTATNPDKALEIFLTEVPEVAVSSTGREFAKTGIGLSCAVMLSEEARQHGVGWVDMVAAGDMIDRVMRSLGGPDDKKPVAAELFTNRFVEGGRLTPEQWQAANAASADYRKLMGA